MLDRHLVPRVRPVLARLARPLAQRGISADTVTVAGFLVGLSGVALIIAGHSQWALLPLMLNRLADGLDGEIARVDSDASAAPAAAGAYLDITLDFLIYALVPLAFALAQPEQNALAAAVLIASFIGTGASFLAFAAQAKPLAIEHPHFPWKGLYYLDGLAEGSETILFIVVVCLFPDAFVSIAYGFALLCLITTFNRIVGGYRALRQGGPSG